MEIGVLLYHHVNEFDFVGPFAVFSTSRRLLEDQDSDGESTIAVTTVARSRFSVQTSGGLTVTPAWAFASAPDFDVLVVPGGPGLDRAAKDPAMRSYFSTRVPAIGLTASISSGSLLLGELGLLAGLEVTGHPEAFERLRGFGDLVVVDRPSVKNERLWCSRSPMEGVELALELVGDRFGKEHALQVRRYLASTTGTST